MPAFCPAPLAYSGRLAPCFWEILSSSLLFFSSLVYFILHRLRWDREDGRSHSNSHLSSYQPIMETDPLLSSSSLNSTAPDGPPSISSSHRLSVRQGLRLERWTRRQRLIMATIAGITVLEAFINIFLIYFIPSSQSTSLQSSSDFRLLSSALAGMAWWLMYWAYSIRFRLQLSSDSFGLDLKSCRKRYVDWWLGSFFVIAFLMDLITFTFDCMMVSDPHSVYGTFIIIVFPSFLYILFMFVLKVWLHLCIRSFW